MANILDGKVVSEAIKEKVKCDVASLKEKGILPHLTVLIIGNNPASQTYVRNKEKTCEQLGFKSTVIKFEEDATQEEVLEKIEELNNDSDVHGILVQLPIPKHFDTQLVLESISKDKDVDGFHPFNAGRMLSGTTGENHPFPCTPAGVIELLKYNNIEIEGKNAVIVGRSNIVGKPLVPLLLNENATVTVCHSKTNNLKEVTKQADILIVAIGTPNFIKKDMVKNGAVVVDVGINRLENGKLTGDVDFEEVKEVASYITPVPGGVGPMTIAMLMNNTIICAKQLAKK